MKKLAYCSFRFQLELLGIVKIKKLKQGLIEDLPSWKWLLVSVVDFSDQYFDPRNKWSEEMFREYERKLKRKESNRRYYIKKKEKEKRNDHPWYLQHFLQLKQAFESMSSYGGRDWWMSSVGCYRKAHMIGEYHQLVDNVLPCTNLDTNIFIID